MAQGLECAPVKDSDTPVGAASAANIHAAAMPGIAAHAAPTSRVALSLLLALLCACAPIAQRETPPEPTSVLYGNPDEVDEAALKACNGDAPVVAIPAANGRGSTDIRCIQAYTGNKTLLDTLKRGSLLLVLDIDDTLLTSDTFFGSDRWYEWQNSLGKTDPDKVKCLFDVIALNYEAGTQHAVEEKTGGVAFINGLKVPKILLTSRGAYSRGGTERELLHAGYELPINLMPSNHGSSWINVRSGKPAPISYANGIQMVTGRDKGQSLLDLLTFHKLRYDNIVLIDDGEANIRSLRQALAAVGINYYGFHYKGVPKKPESVEKEKEEKDEARAAWASWSELMEKRYPSRWARWWEKDGEGCGK
jgi:hypothetical protein